MTENEIIESVKFVVDQDGIATAALLPIAAWEELQLRLKETSSASAGNR